ncbi:hypothetical protein XTPLMG728_0358 [Xanthomonas translucens pv. poae]|uniref:Protein-S-isoprenylcysteine methyltransferase n=1 Tax=Xanthomonas graminis pv. poae TaxID=227946 RepID=A0A0K2ZKG9_9XANT|nr:isoprenylcysteine carboxylmethyltransferase family protein [Xanthomonas translucens]CTP83890.1 hypothetical protein XTPLMG728_0358 [Xanthomonas translucens pv. poae]
MQFLAAMLIGAWLQQALALPLPQGRTLAWMQLAGGVVAAAGLLLSLRCLALFVQRRTTVLPERAPSSLVVRGPYRYSRNPMYLSLLLSYVGLCVQIGWPWALLLPLPLLALQRVLIPFEETRLRERFGSAYVRYCAQVRRWL